MSLKPNRLTLNNNLYEVGPKLTKDDLEPGLITAYCESNKPEDVWQLVERYDESEGDWKCEILWDATDPNNTGWYETFDDKFLLGPENDKVTWTWNTLILVPPEMCPRCEVTPLPFNHDDYICDTCRYG